MKKIKKVFGGFLVLLISFFLMNYSSEASESADTINVTIPSDISIVFDEEGENSISEFRVNNQSLVPITIEAVHVTEYNDWKLVSDGSVIPVNTKKLAFGLENYYLQAGENVVNISIPENTNKKLNVAVKRGAWTTSEAIQTAFNLEFEYTIGKKNFS